MLGYVMTPGRGDGDRLLHGLAVALLARGRVIAGAVQENVDNSPGRRCHMDLRTLSDPSVFRISEDRGPEARGCRLDPQGLTEAVHKVERELAQPGVSLLLVNKFGKQETEGGGFRMLIATALGMGIPVLTSVSSRNLPAFLEFADGMATELPADPEGLLAWCLSASDARAPDPVADA